jgi:hypothetical protein
MPRWASRLTLIVPATKTERLQNISEDDAEAEGARHFPDIRNNSFTHPPCRWSMEDPQSTDQCLLTARFAFANHWIKWHASDQDGWDANPEVVALTVAVHKHNIDRLPKDAAA